MLFDRFLNSENVREDLALVSVEPLQTRSRSSRQARTAVNPKVPEDLAAAHRNGHKS